MSISQQIKNRRSELGITLKQIADQVGVSEATVQRWEAGVITNLRYSRIVKLAKALRMHPGDLMGWEDKNRIYGDALPQELRDIDVEYLQLAKKLMDSRLTADEISRLVDVIQGIKK